MESSVAPVKIGEVVASKYRVDSKIGFGGMATVFEATHLELHEQVALKFLNPQFASSPNVVARFLQEARAMFRLKSAHIGRVLDVGNHGGIPFIVLELLVGETVESLVRREGPLRPELARELMLQACDGIAEAHALGIIHRDIKPLNLFVTHAPDGRPILKVLDFGLSKVRREAAEISLTHQGDVMGTLRYMAPEQLQQSAEANELTDVFSLGAVMYRLLTADFAIQGRSDAELASALLKRRPIRHVRDRRPDLPEDLAAVTMRCLDFAPERRFAHVTDLRKALLALEGFAEAPPTVRPNVPQEDSGIAYDETSAMVSPPAGRPGADDDDTDTIEREAPPNEGYVEEAPTPAVAPKHLSQEAVVIAGRRTAPLDDPQLARVQGETVAMVRGRSTVRLEGIAPRPSSPSMTPMPPTRIPTMPLSAPRSGRDAPTARVPKRAPSVMLGVATGAVLALALVVVIAVVLRLAGR